MNVIQLPHAQRWAKLDSSPEHVHLDQVPLPSKYTTGDAKHDTIIKFILSHIFAHQTKHGYFIRTSDDTFVYAGSLDKARQMFAAEYPNAANTDWLRITSDRAATITLTDYQSKTDADQQQYTRVIEMKLASPSSVTYIFEPEIFIQAGAVTRNPAGKDNRYQFAPGFMTDQRFVERLNRMWSHVFNGQGPIDNNGYPVTPRFADAQAALDMINGPLSTTPGDQEMQWLFKWFRSEMTTNYGKPASTVPFLIGGAGTGKSLLVYDICKIIGDQRWANISDSALSTKFNKPLAQRDKSLGFIDEFMAKGQSAKQATTTKITTLRQFVGNHTAAVESKGTDMTQVTLSMSFIATTNHDISLYGLQADDRRLTFIKSDTRLYGNQQKANHQFYKYKSVEWTNSIDALGEFLYNVVEDNDTSSTVLENAARSNTIDYSAPPAQEFVNELISNGRWAAETAYTITTLYRDFRHWCENERPGSAIMAMKFFKTEISELDAIALGDRNWPTPSGRQRQPAFYQIDTPVENIRLKPLIPASEVG